MLGFIIVNCDPTVLCPFIATTGPIHSISTPSICGWLQPGVRYSERIHLISDWWIIHGPPPPLGLGVLFGPLYWGLIPEKYYTWGCFFKNSTEDLRFGGGNGKVYVVPPVFPVLVTPTYHGLPLVWGGSWAKAFPELGGLSKFWNKQWPTLNLGCGGRRGGARA
jgi:hypothetical protein